MACGDPAVTPADEAALLSRQAAQAAPELQEAAVARQVSWLHAICWMPAAALQTPGPAQLAKLIGLLHRSAASLLAGLFACSRLQQQGMLLPIKTALLLCRPPDACILQCRALRQPWQRLPSTLGMAC